MRTPNRIDDLMSGLATLLVGLLLAITTASAAAQGDALPDNPLAEPDRWISEQRWSELRYGLSIREPHEPTRIADTPQGDVIRWALTDGTRIRLSFARGMYEGIDAEGRTVRMPARIDMLKKQISDELNFALASTVVNTRADQVIVVNNTMPGVINYYTITPREIEGEPYLYGVALIQLDDMSVAVLRMECPPDVVVQAVSTFECMVNSIQVEPAVDVNQRLHGWLTNGENMLNSITQEDRLAAMRPDRLFRVIEAGQDIAYLRIWQRYQDAAYYEQREARLQQDDPRARLQGINGLRMTGNVMITQAHYEAQSAQIDRLYETVDVFEENEEYWQINNALSFENDPQNLRAGAWVETGVRAVATIGGEDVDHIHVSREGTPPRNMVEYLLARERDPERRLRYPSADPRSYPAGEMVELEWPTPRVAFLSFVDAALMPALLPREEQTYAFSAYDPETSRVDIRLMRVVPRDDGGKTVYLRPVLDQSEQVLIFDANNELVSHTFPDGRSLRRTTRQELARVWGVRLRN